MTDDPAPKIHPASGRTCIVDTPIDRCVTKGGQGEGRGGHGEDKGNTMGKQMEDNPTRGGQGEDKEGTRGGQGEGQGEDNGQTRGGHEGGQGGGKEGIK